MKSQGSRAYLAARGALSLAVLSLAAVGPLADYALAAGGRGVVGSPVVFEEAEIHVSDASAWEFFGERVSYSDGRIVVGSSKNDPFQRAGAAYIFERDDSGEWMEITRLIPSDPVSEHIFGSDVALSGSRAAVGAVGDDAPDVSSTGAVYVFDRDETGTWRETAKLVASDRDRGDHLGRAVALSGDIVLAGAPDEDDLGSHAGAAYIFERNEAGVWIEVVKLLASDGGERDYFGDSVALSGVWALIGAAADSVDPGAAYLFERDSAGEWTEVAELLPSNDLEAPSFGFAVSLWGDRALVGAPGTGYDDDDGPGQVAVFERQESGGWARVTTLRPADGADNDNFGNAVSIRGDRAVVSANSDDDNGEDSGSAYVFEREESGEWREIAKLLPSDGLQGERFANDIGQSEDLVLLGVAYDRYLGHGTGSVYSFSLGACSLELSLEPAILRSGDDLQVTIHLEHNRLETATVPFLVWVEAEDGTLVAHRTSSPQTFRHGDRVDAEVILPLPFDLAPGTYHVLVGVERMQQGLAWVDEQFDVLPSTITRIGERSLP